jgi:Cys-tRNA synthase (O-phospho-L-seryl-tRNA:Cys-tRNA synthase)
MKKFAQYLAESERTYDYRIKLLGKPSAELIRDLKQKLDQFDPVSMGDVKTTPIQKVLTDFPNNPNDSVSMFDVSFKYPAIEPQIKQLAQLMGIDPNRVVMSSRDYNEGMAEEYKKIADQNKDLIDDTDYPAPDAQQRALSKDYATGPYDHAVLKNAYRSSFSIAGEKTPPAKTTNELPQGNKSPMTNIKRQPKPATGANPRG